MHDAVRSADVQASSDVLSAASVHGTASRRLLGTFAALWGLSIVAAAIMWLAVARATLLDPATAELFRSTAIVAGVVYVPVVTVKLLASAAVVWAGSELQGRGLRYGDALRVFARAELMLAWGALATSCVLLARSPNGLRVAQDLGVHWGLRLFIEPDSGALRLLANQMTVFQVGWFVTVVRGLSREADFGLIAAGTYAALVLATAMIVGSAITGS